ncbi:MAG: restriction endonuclease subunit S [Rikenellaceae bacterium]|nr:restriction endonuclease subunit S [Rikenellaceae bacterium]
MTKLQDIATIQTGVFAKNSPKPNALYLQQSDFDGNGELRKTAKPTIVADNPKHLLAAGDLLLASKGNNNICIVVPSIEQKCVASPSFLVIRLHDKSAILPEFVAWYLNLSTTQKVLAAQARGTSIMSISKATLGELEIPIPPIERQKKYIELSKLQKREQELYKAIAEKRRQLLEYKMIKNI